MASKLKVRLAALVAGLIAVVGVGSPATAAATHGASLPPSFPQAKPSGSGDHHVLPIVGQPRALSGGPYWYVGAAQDVDAADPTSEAEGIKVRIQAWHVPGITGQDHSIGEFAIQHQQSGTMNDMAVEMGYRNNNGTTTNPQLFVGAHVNGTWLGYGTGFTACTSTAVSGCAAPAWIPPNNNLSSNAQYEMEFWYTHEGTPSEGWWAAVKGSGAIPAGKQRWLGYFKDDLWKNASPAVTLPHKVDVAQVYGEVYDPDGCVNMGTGAFPTSNSGALFDNYEITNLLTSVANLNINTTTDPSWYDRAAASARTFRYGGPGQC